MQTSLLVIFACKICKLYAVKYSWSNSGETNIGGRRKYDERGQLVYKSMLNAMIDERVEKI